ncbi:hypothetical protein Val02_20820 [Virgisporangium aliadipatigenens]|uniref:VWFA domain-containing protein n=1 Tax=Virgisporangium aliadipatigenens TaxID=741659 RepID=A0A8J3YHH5_9ACTN|nr:VWA domain-containing protein [Virgisporangium aliadipatigenens]GIJ45196.1 hypothetical protein Val02_20820 [Virgisporangium aliadipatigenens]
MTEQVLPFYLVCDESGSMAALIDMMNNDLLPELHEAIGTNPVVADKTRFSIIGFADDARELLPLSDLSEVDDIEALMARGMTSYTAAFDLLRDLIDRDVAALKAAGHVVFRPAAFFLSDGQPSEHDWQAAHDRVVDASWKYRPNIIAFGLGDADADTISKVATFKAFIADGAVSPAKALTEFASALTKSIVKSGTTATPNLVKLQMPEEIDGFTELAVDAL